MQEYIDTVAGCSKRLAALDTEIERAERDATVWPVIEAKGHGGVLAEAERQRKENP
jgi:hypothetical protein